MRPNHCIASVCATSFLAVCLLLSSGCAGKKLSWLSPWGGGNRTEADLLPPEPLDPDGIWATDLPNGFLELPIMNPDDLPPLTTVEPRGIELAEAPRKPVQPVGTLQPVFFPFDSSDLSAETRRVLDANAQWLRDHPDMQVQIEGHCDERGTVPYNFSLGQRRADKVREYLSAQGGIHPARLYTISYGEERPLELGSSESAYSRNRRVQFMAY